MRAENPDVIFHNPILYPKKGNYFSTQIALLEEGIV